MKQDIKYEFHHMGIPISDIPTGAAFSEKVGMYTSDNPGIFKIQWHYFTNDSPLHPLIKTVPHIAFKVDDLSAAIAGEEVILGPYEPIDDYFVAMINDHGVPIEFVQTILSDEEIWERARLKQGALYRE